MNEISLHSFFGNRFNILFLNGAGVYFLYEKFISFMSLVEKDAVHHDLQVIPYRVGCRALGLIHKLITGPLWRKMRKIREKCIKYDCTLSKDGRSVSGMG